MQATEIVLLLVLAVVILGPHRLPEYAAKLAAAVRSLRELAEGAKSQIRQEMGPAFDDVDWSQLDPRQYDPRRIVRDALAGPVQDISATGRRAITTAQAAGMGPVDPPENGTARQRRSAGGRNRAAPHDPSLPTPFDTDAT